MRLWWPAMRYYSPIQRRRAWNKFSYLRARYPGLTLKDAASQITTLRGGNFHLKYFQRLESATLGDGLVNDVVEWITDKFDKSFSSSFSHLIAEDKNYREKPWMNLLGKKNLWKPVSKDLEYAVKYAIKLNGTICLYPSFPDIQIIFMYLGFLDNCKFIKCIDLAGLGSFTEYYIEYNGYITSFDGKRDSLDRVVSNIPIALTDLNMIHYCEFMLNYIEGVDGLILNSVDDFVQSLISLDEDYGLNIEISSNIYEPVQLLFGDNYLDAQISFDFILDNHSYCRGTLQLNGSITHYKFQKFIVVADIRDLLTKTHNNYTYDLSNKEELNNKIYELINHISLSSSGRSLVKLISNNIVRVIGLYGPTKSFSYNHYTKNIAIIFSPQGEFSIPKECSRLIFALFQAAANTAGLTPPSRESSVEFAAYNHGLTLDCFTATCKFIKQMVELPDNMYSVRDYFFSEDIEIFYNLWKSGSTREQLYYLYAQLYDQHMRG